MKLRICLTSMIVLLALAFTGCVRPFVEADALRKDALYATPGPVAEYVTNHPKERERWTDFGTAWQSDIDANRKGVLPWWLGGGQNVTPPVAGGN